MTRLKKNISKYKPSAFQGQFTFVVSKERATLALEHPYERIALSGLSLVLALLLCAYLYFVAVSVLNVIARKEAVSQAERLKSTTSGLEQRYFALSRAVTEHAGNALGLAPLSSTDYVYRPGTLGAAALSENEI